MKFFLFRREEVNEGSVKSSNSGIGLSVFAIPVNQMSFMTAVKGAINITFNDAGVYDHAALIEGESFEKTSVSVACIKGQEIELMEDILNFVTSEDPNKKIMKFDVVTGKSSFDSAVSKGVEDVSTKVKTSPTVMTSGEISKGDSFKEYQDSIGGIYFGADKPSLDFNHEGLASYADNAEVTSWENAGTAGATHSISANQGSPNNELTFTESNLSKASVRFTGVDYFTIPNAYSVENEYTLYFAVGLKSIRGMSVLYGDAVGGAVGMCLNPTLDWAGLVAKNVNSFNNFSVRHDGRTGEVASVLTTDLTNGTQKYRFPENYYDPDLGEATHVFVLRRDKNSNMYLHNREGEMVAFIPGFTKAMTFSGKLTDLPGMTDGNLLIEQLGSAKGIVTSGLSNGFMGYLSRFGVIEKDIGTSKAGQLARDLFSLYNF